jgi:ribose/xylose/arabinose/galactoside ABC-type transport system permease subunit
MPSNANLKLESSVEAVIQEPRTSRLGRIGGSEHLGLLAAFFLLCAVLSVTAPYFLTVRNITNVLQQVSFLGIIALGMTLVIVAGEIDISVGSAMALYSALLGCLSYYQHWPLWIAVLVVLALGAVIGVCAGYVRARFNIPSFIITLALLSALSGFGLWLTNASPIPISDAMFRNLGTGRLFDLAVLPIPLVVFLTLFVVFWFISTRTTFGRSVYAVGGNPEAARVSGISLTRVRVLIFAGTGFLAAVSAVLYSSLIQSGNGQLGQGAEFQVIAAVIVGGTSLYGGRGSMVGTLIGVLFIGVLDNGMVLLNVNQYAQQVAHGFIILIAVLGSEGLRGGAWRRWIRSARQRPTAWLAGTRTS